MQNRGECRAEPNAEHKAETRAEQKAEAEEAPQRRTTAATQRRKPAEFRAMKEKKCKPELAGERSVRVSARGDYCHAHKERRTSSASNAAHWSASRAQLHNVRA